jgi:hypothetical protein
LPLLLGWRTDRRLQEVEVPGILDHWISSLDLFFDAYPSLTISIITTVTTLIVPVVVLMAIFTRCWHDLFEISSLSGPSQFQIASHLSRPSKSLRHLADNMNPYSNSITLTFGVLISDGGVVQTNARSDAKILEKSKIAGFGTSEYDTLERY